MPNMNGPKLYANTQRITATVTPSTTGYASGDIIGSLITFSNVLGRDAGGGIIKSAMLVDMAKQVKKATLLLFKEALATGGITADNSALDLADTDIPNITGRIVFGTGSYVSLADNAVAFSTDKDVAFELEDGNDLYGLLLSGGTGTYTSGEDLTVILEIQTD